MYSLDINFLNDRPEYRTDAGATAKPRATARGLGPLILGTVLGIALPALAGGAWLYLQNRNATLETRSQELDAQIGALQAKLKEAEAFNAQAQQINAEADALAGVFKGIKPWSAMLQDISERTPTGAQLDSIQENAGVITLAGTARTLNDVNDFLLTLQKSPFLDAAATQLGSAQMVDYPGKVEFRGLRPGQSPTFELPQVASYRITTRFSDTPANQLVRELDRKGSVGLVTRIRSLQEKGVIQ